MDSHSMTQLLLSRQNSPRRRFSAQNSAQQDTEEDDSFETVKSEQDSGGEMSDGEPKRKQPKMPKLEHPSPKPEKPKKRKQVKRNKADRTESRSPSPDRADRHDRPDRQARSDRRSGTSDKSSRRRDHELSPRDRHDRYQDRHQDRHEDRGYRTSAEQYREDTYGRRRTSSSKYSDDEQQQQQHSGSGNKGGYKNKFKHRADARDLLLGRVATKKPMGLVDLVHKDKPKKPSPMFFLFRDDMKKFFEENNEFPAGTSWETKLKHISFLWSQLPAELKVKYERKYKESMLEHETDLLRYECKLWICAQLEEEFGRKFDRNNISDKQVDERCKQLSLEWNSMNSDVKDKLIKSRKRRDKKLKKHAEKAANEINVDQ